MPGELFSIAFGWLMMGHLFLETLRAESICWGFVRVQQLFCVIAALMFVYALTLFAKTAAAMGA